MGKTLSLNHTLSEISKDNFADGLVNLIHFDEDLNGNNGKDYTRKEAIDKGFDSTLEWLTHEAIEKHGETENAINYLIDNSIGEDSYYESVEYDVIEQDKVFIVSVACMGGS